MSKLNSTVKPPIKIERIYPEEEIHEETTILDGAVLWHSPSRTSLAKALSYEEDKLLEEQTLSTLEQEFKIHNPQFKKINARNQAQYVDYKKQIEQSYYDYKIKFDLKLSREPSQIISDAKLNLEKLCGANATNIINQNWGVYEN